MPRAVLTLTERMFLKQVDLCVRVYAGLLQLQAPRQHSLRGPREQVARLSRMVQEACASITNRRLFELHKVSQEVCSALCGPVNQDTACT